MFGTRSLMLPLFLALALMAGWPGGQTVRAQDDPPHPGATDVETVFRAAYDALNAGDVEANMAHYAPDAVSVSLPPPPGSTGVEVGHDAIRAIAEDLISRNIHVEIMDFQAVGDSAALTARVTEDMFTDLGVAPVELTGATTVQNGLIVMESWTMREESFARFMAAIQAADNKAVVQRLYDEVYSDQAPQTLEELAAADALAGYQAAVAAVQSAYPDLTATVDDLLVDGDRVVAVVTFTGTSGSGETVTWSQVEIHRIVDGLLAGATQIGGPPASDE
jgi:ketosteroid isomerase-like protein